MTTPTTITRDELAAKMRISSNALRKREHRLGLKICKVKLSTRPPQYVAAEAIRIVRALGFPV
jgi:hypothetical protein